jgi:hypothetical protein
MTFDLTGLPPAPGEIRQFLEESVRDEDAAIGALVDRLLGSEHYGERWGRHWLDVARYADTCGYDKDKLRPNAWPYRDYVIRSFNEDKPYKKFVEEQVAGDALYPGTADGILGLGFLAAGPWDFIGHVEVPESKIDGRVARHIDRDEMVTSVLNTFTSATVQCARCHDHKFDPITQEHYYGLQAVFAAVDRAERPYDLDPAIPERRLLLQERIDEARSGLSSIRKEILQSGGEELARLNQRIKTLEEESQLSSRPEAYGYHSAIAADQNTEKWVQVDLGTPQKISSVVLRACHDDFAGIGAGFGFPVRFRVEVSLRDDFGDPQILADFTDADFPNPGLAAMVLPAGEDVPDGVMARVVRVTATKLAPRSGDYIMALAELEVTGQDGRSLSGGAKVAAMDSIEAPVRWQSTNLTDGLFPLPRSEEAAEELRTARQSRAELLDRLETPEIRERRSQLENRLKEAEAAIGSLPEGAMVYAASTHFQPQGNFKPTMGVPREIRVLHRGNILNPGEAAAPGVIPVFPDEGSELNLENEHGEAARRAALARWITRDDHPLTWRSIVNRVWLWHFGEGLVGTPNDFGRMGMPPSHPELLDWLAVEFRDSGGSFKHLHRLIMTSAVYLQSSAHRRDQAEVDANNRYLWRMNRRRLAAEELRDSILAVSDALDRSMGGPGFYLFNLEKTEHSPHYEYHKFDPGDPESHRRSVYRFVVRSQPDPFMTTLDCADSSQSTPKRNETLTALQALSLLNNNFTLHMADRFAARLKQERPDDPAGQIERGFQLVTGRLPELAESRMLTDFAAKHGLANYCRILFNLSEFTYLD